MTVQQIQNFRFFNQYRVLVARNGLHGFTGQCLRRDFTLAPAACHGGVDQRRNDFENLLLAIEKNEQQIEAYEAAVNESQRGYDISVKRFDSGLGTQLEVTDAQLVYTNSAINLLQSVHQYYVAHARLEHLLGENNNVYEN